MDQSIYQEANEPELHVDVINTDSLGSVAVIKNVYGFSVDPRFTDLVPIGQGGNGMVFSAVDSDCEKNVAIKKICFSDQKSCKYALRELRAMRQLQHENLVSIYEILGPNGFSLDGKHTITPNSSDFNSFYIVQEHMDISLAQLIQNASLNQDHIKFFLYQLLRGLKYIHSANIIHRDIKPSNILLSLEDLVLKIGDFGLARVVDPSYCHRGYLTDRVGTCWYRAPELILTPRDYTSAIDIWGVGCILGELVTGQPLFPGAQEMEQIGHVLDSISLTDNEWNTVTQVLPHTVMKKHQRFPKMSLKSRLPTVDSNAKDLLECLLMFSPSSRLTAERALDHPYLNQYSCLQDEPIVSRPFRIEHEVDDLPIESLRQLLLNESRTSPEGCGSQFTPKQPISSSTAPPKTSNQEEKAPSSVVGEESSNPGNLCEREVTPNSAEYFHDRVISPSNVGRDIVRDKNTQSSCRSLKESLFIDITDIENAKEFCQLSPKEKADRINIDKSYDKNNPTMSVKMKDRLNEKRRGRSPSDCLSGNSANPLQTPKTGGEWQQLASSNDRVAPFPLDHHRGQKVEDKNIRNSPDSQNNLHREKSRSKESLFKKQMSRQKKNKQRAMNVRDFDNLYRLPTEHLRRRRRTDDRLLSIKPLPEYNNIENHVKLREELNERLRLAEMERDHIRGAVGGTCTLDEIARPIGQITLDNDHIWNAKNELSGEKKSGFDLKDDKNTGKTRRDSSSSSDDQRFEG